MESLWRTAPLSALHAALVAEQLAGDGATCTAASPLSFACLGACRNGGHEPIHRLEAASPALRSAWRGEATTAGVEALLRQVTSGSNSSCTLLFAGDSVSHDTYVAALAGAIKLGLHINECIWRGPPPCKPGSARGTAPCKQLAARPPRRSLCVDSHRHNFSADPASSVTFALPRQWRRRPNGSSCTSLRLQHMQLVDLISRPPLAASVLGGGRSVTVVINEGLWANRPAELISLLERHVRPLLVTLAATPRTQRASLLWRETTPQHFRGRSGTGLYAERSGSAATGGQHSGSSVECAPVLMSSVEHVRKANWRNKLFEKWSRPWRVRAPSARAASSRRLAAAQAGGAKSRASSHHVTPTSEHLPTPAWGSGLPPGEPTTSVITIVPAFEALLVRHDLHAPPDCTHFCYSPFVWEPLWQAAAAALERLVRTAPER